MSHVAQFDSAQFRRVLGHFPTGVTVITAMTEEGPVGLTVGSFFSVSLEPPLVAFCAGHSSTTYPKLRPVGTFCVNVLAEDQEHVSRLFAGRGSDRFAGVGWRPATTPARRTCRRPSTRRPGRPPPGPRPAR